MSKNIENKYFIKNSDSVFRKIFEIHDSIMMLIESETGIIIDVNNSAVNFYGYSKSEFSSMTIYDIINMPKEQAYQEMQKSINKEHKSMIFRHRLAGGDIREVEVHSSVIDNDARRLILLMIYDLSKRNFAEEALAFEKSRLSEIIKGTNVGTWEWNVRTGETIFNDRWAAIIGYTLEEISPVSINTWMKYVHPDDSKISDDLLELHFKGELDYYDCEVRMKHKNGQWVWILDRGRVYIWDDDGKPLLMSGTHQDITHRKYAEEKLKQSEQKLSAYINSSPLGIFIVNDIGIFEEVNPAGARMLGYSEKELVKYNITHVIDISSQEKAKEHFRTVQIEGSSESEHLLKRKNGTKFWGYVSVVKLYDNRQIAFVQDINSRKKADELLNQTRQNYETFFNTIDELLLVIDEKSNIIHANKTVYNRL
ncbi:MAG: two-component system, sensor histidine kinase and response regulator, partial [Bacteroidota bacterium]|nr:two-component system, sensor histidine kinase and response regulator [Bacteroidota bacterium]